MCLIILFNSSVSGESFCTISSWTHCFVCINKFLRSLLDQIKSRETQGVLYIWWHVIPRYHSSNIQLKIMRRLQSCQIDIAHAQLVCKIFNQCYFFEIRMLAVIGFFYRRTVPNYIGLVKYLSSYISLKALHLDVLHDP